MQITIITINYNNSQGLKKTIDSIKAQTFREFEYIIIDGGSTDDSGDLIKQNKEVINYWISERDNGVYHAMNKGIQQAKGRYLQFLNSGDILYNENVLADLVSEMEKRQFANPDIFYSNLSFGTNVFKPDPVITLSTFTNSFIPHPSSFTKREILLEFSFDENFKIISDWIFFLKCYLNQLKFEYIDLITSEFETAGLSSNFLDIKKETDLALETIFPNVAKDIKSLHELRAFKLSKAHKLLNLILNFIKRE